MVPLILLFVISVLSTAINGDAVSAIQNQNQLVDQICNQTSNYSTCANSLYSDPRTPGADQYTLAYIAVDLAYGYAVSTRNFVAQLVTNGTSSEHNLQICVSDYNDAVSKLATANNDLNSETFFELGALSGKAADSADHCRKNFPTSPALTVRSKEFRSLCEIVGAVGKLFTGRIIY